MTGKCGMLKSRKDDIPKKRKGEKTWVCSHPDCNVVMFAVRKPPCQFAAQQELQRKMDEHEVS